MRFDSARLGRFTSPDPTADSISPADPQSWNRYSYVGNDPCNAVDPMGLATCTFYIKINNKAGLSDSQLAELEGRINAVFGSAQSDGNSVQAQFSGSGKPDFQLNISPKSGMLGGEGYSGWPASSPVIYWGAMSDFQHAATYGGTAAAHEIVHRGAGPRFDLWGKYDGNPNLMNVNQAQSAGLGQQVINDWSNPNAAAGFASLSPAQVQKLFTKCTKKHGTVRTSDSLDDIGLAGQGDGFYWFEMLFTSSDDASVSTSWDPNNYRILPP